MTLEPTEGARFLLQRNWEAEKEAALDSVDERLRRQAEDLSLVVDGLPLALDQAAAFMDEARITPGCFWKTPQDEQSLLLTQQTEPNATHPPITATFSLAFKKIEEISPTAADLLRVCAFLAADAIPEEIFSKGAEDLGDFLSLYASNPYKLNRVITEAGRFSLLQRNAEAETVSLHGSVQDVLKNEMVKHTQRIWAERTVRAVSRTFPTKVEYRRMPA